MNFSAGVVDNSTRFDASDMNPILASLDKCLSYKHNMIVHCDGNIHYNKSTGVFTWTGTIRIYFNNSIGKIVSNTIAAGSVTLADNEFAYVTLNETNATALTVSKASVTLDAASNCIAVGILVLGYRNTTSDIVYPVSLTPVLAKPQPLNKLDATAAPTANDDTGDGYSVGSLWVDVTNDNYYFCVDATASSAVWSSGGGSGNAIELKGYSETEDTVAGASGTAVCDYSAGNVQIVTIEAGTDTDITFSNLPAAGKAASATLLLEMAGAVPSDITIETISLDLTGVTSGGQIIAECQRIGNTWFVGVHHAS